MSNLRNSDVSQLDFPCSYPIKCFTLFFVVHLVSRSSRTVLEFGRLVVLASVKHSLCPNSYDLDPGLPGSGLGYGNFFPYGNA